ncbi:MAG: radical SAM protein [Candidatus Omnitrophota bacterium]
MEVLAVANALYADRNADLGTLHRVIGRAEMRDLNHERTTRFEMQETNGRQAAGIDEMGSVHAQDLSLKKNVMSRRSESRDDQEVPLNSRLEKIPEKDRRVAAQRIWQLLLDRYQFPEKGSLIEFVSSEPSSVPEVLASRKFKGTLMLTGGNKAVLRNLERYRHLLPGAKIIPVLLDAFNQGSGFLNPVDGVIVNAFTRMSSEDSSRGLDWKSFFIKASPAFVIASRDALLRNDRISSDDFRRAKDLFEQISASVPKNTRDLESEMIVETEGFESDSWMAFCLRPILSLEQEMRKEPQALDRLGRSSFIRQTAYKDPVESMAGIYGNRAMLGRFLPPWTDSKNMLDAIERQFSVATLKRGQGSDGLKLEKYLPVFVDYQFDPTGIATNGNLGSGRAFYIGSRFNVKGVKTALVSHESDKWHSDGFLDLPTAVWEAIVSNSLHYDLRTGTAPVLGIIDAVKTFDNPSWPGSREAAALLVRMDDGSLDRPTHLFKKNEPLNKKRMLRVATMFGKGEAEKFIERIFHGAWSAGNISVEGRMLDYDTVLSVRHRPPQVVGKTFYTTNLFGLEQNGQLMILEGLAQSEVNRGKVSLKDLKHAMEEAYASQIRTRFLDLMGLSTPFKDAVGQQFERELKILADEFQALSRMMLPRYNAWDIHAPDHDELAVFDFSNFFRYYPLLRRSPQWSIEKAFFLLLNPDAETERKENDAIPDFMKRYVEEHGYVVQDDGMLEDCCRRALFFIFAYDSLFAKIRGSVFAPLEDSAEMKAYIVNEDRSYLSPLFGRRIKQNLVEMYQGRKIKAERFSLLIDKIVQASRRVPSRIFDNYYLADMELYVNGYSGKLLSKDGSFRFFTAFFDQEEMPKEQGSWSIRLNGKKYDCAIERHDDEMWVISPAFDNQKLLENLVPTLLFKNRKFRLQSLGPSRPVFAPFMKDDPSVIKGLERLQQMRQVSSMDTNGKAGSPGMSFDLSQFDPARMTWDQFMGLIWQDIFKKIQLPKDGVVVEVAPGSGSQIAWGLKKYGFLGTVYVLEPAKVIKKAVDSYQRLVPGVKVVSIQKTLREGMESLPRNPHLVVGNHALDDMFLGEILPLKEVAEIFDHSDRLPASVAVKAWRRAEKGLSVLKRLVSEGRVLRDWICLMAEVTPQWLILNHYLSYYYSEKGCHFPNQEGFSLLARLSHMFLGLGCDVEFLRRRFIETSDLWVAIRPGKARSLRDSQRNKPNRTALDKRSEMRLKQEPAAEKEPNDKNPRGAEMLSSIDSSKEFARVDGLGLDSVDLIEQGPRPDNKFTDLPRIESQENWEQSPLSPISDQMPPDAAEAPGHNQTKSSVPYIREMRLMDDSLTPVRIGEGLYQIADETSLSIVMTDLCNGNCAFCINKTGSQHSGEAVARNFPQKLSKAMSAYHVKDVVLLGGEPLLARHLGEVLGELDKVKDQLDEVTVTTNGTPLRDKNILELVGNSSITSVNISYHHYDKKRNDAIMETSTLTIGEIEEINRFLMSRGKTLRVNLIAFKSGIDNVSDLERFAESFSNKIDVIKLTPMYPTASYETIDSVSEFTKSHAFSRQEWMQLLDGLSAKGEVLAENEDIFGVQRTLIKLPSGVKILFVNPYTDKKEPTKIRSVKILSDGKMSLSWLGHGPDLMTAPVEFPRIPDTGEEKEIFTADGREMKAAEADRAMAKDITVRSEMRSEDAAVASLSHYPINSIVGGFKVEEVASLLGISEAETQTRLAALTTEGTLLRFHVTTGKEPDQSEQSFREGKLTIDEFLERESAFYRGQGAERFLMAGSLLRKAALTLKRGELSDEHLYQMAEALTLLFGDKLNYTLRQALGLWSSAEVYLQEEEVAEIAEINNRLEMINKRNQGIQRDIFSKKIPFDNQYRQDWKKMSRTDVVSLIKEVLVEIKKGIDDIRWLQAQDVGGLENRLRANPIDRADALLTLMAYKKGLQTGLAQLEMVYGIYSETMTDQAVASGDAAMAKDAPVRSEARVQPIAPIMNKAVLVIEQTTIDLMTATDFKKLLCLAGTRRSEIRLVIPDVVHGQYSNRVVALRSVATVDIRLPEMARSGKIPVFGFSDMERDTVGAFKARLGRAEPRIVPHLQECFALDGMDGIVLALLVNRPEDLQMKNGFLYDQTGRFRSEVRAFVEALVQNYVVISSAA